MANDQDLEALIDATPAAPPQGRAAPAAQPMDLERLIDETPAAGPSGLEAFGRGALQGASLGFGDEISGASNYVEQQIVNHLLPRALKAKYDLVDAPAGDAYRFGRDEERRKNAEAEQAHRWAYLGGNVAGAALTAPILPGSSAKTLSAVAKTGAGLGALAGLGSSDADLTTGDASNYGQAALDTGIGGATGYLLPKALGKVTSAPGFRKLANALAVEALGTRLPQYRALEYQEAVQPLGRELLDKGIIPWRGGAENIRERAAAEMAKQGKTIGATLERLDAEAGTKQGEIIRHALPKALAEGTPQPGLIPVQELGIKAPVGQWAEEPASEVTANVRRPALTSPGRPPPAAAPRLSEVDELFVRPSNVRQKALDEVVAPLEHGGKARAFVGQSVPDTLRGEIEAIHTPNDRMGFRESNELLRLADQRIGDAYNREGSMTAEGLKRVRGILRSEQQAAAERVSPELAQQLSQAKTSYGNMARAAQISEDRALRNLANRDFAPSDYAAAIGSYLREGSEGGPGDAAKGFLTGLAHKLVRERGNAFTANALNVAGKALESRPVIAARASPLLRRALAGEAARAAPQARVLLRALGGDSGSP